MSTQVPRPPKTESSACLAAGAATVAPVKTTRTAIPRAARRTRTRGSLGTGCERIVKAAKCAFPRSAGQVWQARRADRLREVSVGVDKALERDRELRTKATARPWHEDGSSTTLRLVGPLPRSTIVVDPYGPNPQDARLLMHRVNSYEELEEEIERLRAWLRDIRARLDGAPSRATSASDEDFEYLARDLR